MSAALTDEQEEWRTTVERFAHKEVAPVIGDLYERGEFPYQIVAAMGALGLFGLPFPEEYGGMGGDYFALCLALEELARVDSSVAITLEAGVGLGAMPIYRFGTEAQKQQWLPRLCAGTMLGAFGLTEPGGGSDAGATSTTARLEGGEWVIDGTKAFITNSGTDITGLVTVTAVTGRGESGRPDISAIIVPSGTPGFTVSKKYSKVGWLASDTRELSFGDCRVPEANLLGEVGRGYAQFLRILDEGRIAIAALSVGLAQGCIDESLRYVDEREAFGHKISEYQVLQFKLADMEARTHVARLAYYHAAALLTEGRPLQKRGRHRQAGQLRRGHGQRQGGDPDLRRLRVYERNSRRTLLPRRQDPRDRRGDLRSAADSHRPRTGPPGSGVGWLAVRRGTQPEGLGQLGQDHAADPRCPSGLLDRDRPAGDAGGDRRSPHRECGSTAQLIPAHQDEPEVHCTAPVDRDAGVVEAVVGRADEDPSERPEGPTEVGVRKGHQAAVGDQGGAGESPARPEQQRRQQRRKIRGVHEGMGAERGEDAHVLLGVVQGMESPQCCGPMVGDVSEPVHGIGPNQDDADEDDPRCEWQPFQEQEAGVPVHFDGEASLDEGQNRYHDDGEEGEVTGVDEVSARQQGPLDCGPSTLGEQDGGDHDDERGADHVTPRRQGVGKVARLIQHPQPDPPEPRRDSGQGEDSEPRARPSCSPAHPGVVRGRRRRRRRRQ